MKKCTSLLGLLLFLAQLTAQTTSQETAWLQRHVNPIASIEDDDFRDLQFLKPLLKGVKIVQLGESSHGIGDYYQLKGRLVKFLHQEMGFSVLAMEGGFGDINTAYTHLQDFSAEEMMQRTIFGNFRCKEMLGLFDYLKQNHASNPLHLTGFDCQTSAEYFEGYLSHFIRPFDSLLGAEFDSTYYSTYDLYGLVKDSVRLMNAIAANREILDKVELLLKAHRAEIEDETQFPPHILPVLLRSIYNKRRYWDFDFPAIRAFRQFGRRDSLMADNLRWISENLYPNRKIIVWAHNAHINAAEVPWTDPEGNKPKMQGELVNELFGKENFTIGIFAYQGETYRHFKQDYVSFVNDSTGCLEERLNHLEADINFLPFKGLRKSKPNHWLFEPVWANELENGGYHAFPSITKAFDAVIVLRNVTRPSYFR